MFLLSIKELKEYIADRRWNWIKEPTATAKSQLDEESIMFGNYKHCWLRTPGSDFESRRAGFSDEMGHNYGVSLFPPVFDSGICPAVYIDLSKVDIVSGYGSLEEPFTIK